MSHTVWLRINSLATFAVTALAILVALASLTDVTHSCTPTSSRVPGTPPRVVVTGFERFVNVSGEDEAIVQMDFDVDMSKCFSWNTKLIFAHVVMSYATEAQKSNAVTAWDAIATTPEASVFKGLRMAKYRWRDVQNGLRGAEVHVNLSWAVTPVVGKLWRGSTKVGKFRMPTEYIAPRPAEAAKGGGRVPGMP